jgi:RhoGAP domain
MVDDMFEKKVAVRGALPPIRGSHVESNSVFDKFERAIECVEALSDDQLCMEGIYRHAVSVSSVTSLYSCSLDPDSVSLEMKNDTYPYTISCVLKYAFGQLIDQAKWVLVAPDSEAALKKAVDDLGKSTESAGRLALVCAVFSHFTPRAQIALKRVLDHLNRVASFSDKNKMTPENLAIGFLGPKLGCVVWSALLDQFQKVGIGNKAAEFLIDFCDSVSPVLKNEAPPVVTRPISQPVQRTLFYSVV